MEGKPPSKKGSAKPAKPPVGRPFAKGQSGNPGGRTPGFGKRIRKLTEDGAELVDIALSVARGELKVEAPYGKDAFMVSVAPSCKERMDAVRWLADRGFGKQGFELEDEDGNALQVTVKLEKAP
jgi:hypothetical protein